LEHYIEGRASWVFDMQAPFKTDMVGNGCGSPRNLHGGPSVSPISTPVLVFHVYVANRGIVNHWNEKPVFVSRVEQVHGPDGKIPSIVGLYLAYEESEEFGDG